ncbi:MAG: hypothetical protein J6L88_05075 [Clostridia bacterium]|nr:hypothetical protein [Clostridia bacterium]
MAQQLAFRVNEHGFLTGLCLGHLTYGVDGDDILIYTDAVRYSLRELPCEKQGDTFVYRVEGARFTLYYVPVEGASFVNRVVSMRFSRKTQLLRVEQPLQKAGERFLYHTFYNASAAVFERKGKLGICRGFANPFVTLEDDQMAYAPSLILETGQWYTSDANFIGIYKLTGEMIRPETPHMPMRMNGRDHSRYRNPSEGIALDFAEIRNFNDYTADYLDIKNKKFTFTSYNFFSNLPQRPETAEHLEAYHRHVAAFGKLTGDTLIFNPLCPNKIPNADPDSYWELFPEGSTAEELLIHARENNLRVGMYTGTAGNGLYGNATMIPYANNPTWKKIDVMGNVSGENCICDEGFLQWYVGVQKNTIKKYGLHVWDWDPGPGNGMFCYSDQHEHLPGKGAYKGFRNSIRIMAALKEEFPELYYQGFHGNKEYGVWGFRYIDQHEAYWENEPYVMTHVSRDLSVDRMTANGARQQCQWDYYFRFLPPAMNHGLAHRMAQVCDLCETNLDKIFDYTGWKFALLCAIASGGPVTVPVLPDDPERIDGYIPFYNKWIAWAREHFEYSKHTIPFGSQTGCGGVEGYAKIMNNEGYLFLVNDMPVPLAIDIPLNERIGMEQTDRHFALCMIHPFTDAPDVTYAFGETTSVIVPPYEVLVYHLCDPADSEAIDHAVTNALPRALEVVSPKQGKACASFVMSEEIEEMLQWGKSQLSDENDEVIEIYKRALKRNNVCWTRPDRLWAWVLFEDADQVENVCLLVNGKSITMEVEKIVSRTLRQFDAKTVYFADITDHVFVGEEAQLQVNWEGEQDAPFIYLHYPKADTEAMPQKAWTLPKRMYAAPVQDNSIRVRAAKLNSDNIMLQETENTITAFVDIPAQELEGVYVSTPVSIGDTGNDLKHDMALEYDEQDGTWKKTFRSGKRIHLIVDDDKLAVWAVTKDGRETPALHVPFTWILD